MLNKGERVAFVACSNALANKDRTTVDRLADILQDMGLAVDIYIDYCDTANGVPAGEKANLLMKAYKDSDVKMIFDLSGGDLANEILPYLDYDLIRKSGKMLVGYSDLTCVLNAIFCKSGVNGILYQLKNLVWDTTGEQVKRFYSSFLSGDTALFDYEAKPCIKPENTLSVVGGNARCLLKLAGTEYWPDMQGKLLLLESMGGNAPRIITYFNQLHQMGVFDQTAGVLLGTFTELEKTDDTDAAALLRSVIGGSLPVYKTKEIGHDKMSKAIIIGHR